MRSGKNLIVDRCVHEYYDLVHTVTTGPLFTWSRLHAIVGLNTGKYDYLTRPGCK